MIDAKGHGSVFVSPDAVATLRDTSIPVDGRASFLLALAVLQGVASVSDEDALFSALPAWVDAPIKSTAALCESVATYRRGCARRQRAYRARMKERGKR